jgi:hypothetical protein
MSQNAFERALPLALLGVLFLTTLSKTAVPAFAGGCPTAADEIATDRPDVTNSSLVVPYGSFQVENGVNWAVRQGSDVLDGSETRARLGVAPCTELLLDAPDYIYSLNGPVSSGFSDLVLSVKRQIAPFPANFDLSATAGLGFPSGGKNVSGHGWDPYLQFPWSREIANGWSVSGMFTVTW